MTFNEAVGVLIVRDGRRYGRDDESPFESVEDAVAAAKEAWPDDSEVLLCHPDSLGLLQSADLDLGITRA